MINPWNPFSLAENVELIGPETVPVDPTEWTPVAQPDPGRLGLLLIYDISGFGFFLSPVADPSIQGISAVSSERYILIHTASHPGLCQGNWYVRGNAGTVCYIWQYIAKPYRGK